MTDKQFFPLTLVSNVEGEDNTLAHFTTQLPRDISLDGEWSVGLSEIQYTKSWFNINKYYAVGIKDDQSITYQSPEKLVPGVYDSPADLIREINRCVEKASVSVVNGRTRNQAASNLKHMDEYKCPKLEYNMNSRRVSLKAGKAQDGRKLYVTLDYELKEMLGMTRDDEMYNNEFNDLDHVILEINQELVKGEQDALFVYDLHCGIHNLMVYCDLIKPIITGDTYTQLLRAVPVSHRKFGDQICVTFTKPYFFPLASNNFRSIEISIRDDTGSLIPFKFGRTVVVLEFRKL